MKETKVKEIKRKTELKQKESVGIVCKRMESEGIVCKRMESEGIVEEW